jgi:acyl dehydratase
MVEVGQVCSRNCTLSQDDFDLFAQLSGDDNPIHVDPQFARQTSFERPVAHGMMLYGLICGLLGQTFPGAVQTEVNLIFPAPTFSAEELIIAAEVLTVEQKQITVQTTIKNPAGELTCSGETRLQLEDL